MPAFFSSLIDNLVLNLKSNEQTIRSMLRKNPNAAYQRINQIGDFTGSRYGIQIYLQFPDHAKLFDTQLYGKENIGIVFNKFRKIFPIPREEIKLKAAKLLGKVNVYDANMYEGKEGVRIMLENGRIEILPGSVHMWCMIDQQVCDFGDWLLENVYFQDIKNNDSQ
jgi:hypothetical protein